MKLAWITDRSEVHDYTAIVLSPCWCGAAPGKACVGGTAGAAPDGPKHPAFKWADVHAERLEAQGALL